VLLHPVGSKISSHAFNTHFNVLDLRLSQWRSQGTEQNQQRKVFPIHHSSFLKGAAETAV
jgi:hypothetical protein